MAWPKGVSRKERLAELAEIKANMAFPGEEPPPAHKRFAQIAAEENLTDKLDSAPMPSPKKRPLMKARPNWETYDSSEDSEDRLHIPQEMFPDGYDFQWITHTVLGQEFGQLRSRFERTGWTPVHQEDFNGIFDGRFMTRGAQGEITVDGLVLMARPMEFSIRARKEEQRRAREVVQVKQQQLTGGDLPGVTLDTRHSSALSTNRINRTIEAVEIPKDSESH